MKITNLKKLSVLMCLLTLVACKIEGEADFTASPSSGPSINAYHSNVDHLMLYDFADVSGYEVEDTCDSVMFNLSYKPHVVDVYKKSDFSYIDVYKYDGLKISCDRDTRTVHSLTVTPGIKSLVEMDEKAFVIVERSITDDQILDRFPNYYRFDEDYFKDTKIITYKVDFKSWVHIKIDKGLVKSYQVSKSSIPFLLW
ncbi:MAG: hypothetical protein HOE90_15490 [Bacteriovoracaceae bacterium]|nr:hypothetical protein [Bacteriovoracaceae bacterium]